MFTSGSQRDNVISDNYGDQDAHRITTAGGVDSRKGECLNLSEDMGARTRRKSARLHSSKNGLNTRPAKAGCIRYHPSARLGAVTSSTFPPDTQSAPALPLRGHRRRVRHGRGGRDHLPYRYRARSHAIAAVATQVRQRSLRLLPCGAACCGTVMRGRWRDGNTAVASSWTARCASRPINDAAASATLCLRPIR